MSTAGGARHDVLNAFQPGAAVARPDSFAGRRSQVLQLTDALQMIGTVPLIYGHRGLGKTSLALQIMRIALGDLELLEALGAQDRAPDPDRMSITLYVTCTDAISDLGKLLQLLVNAAEDIDTTEDDSGRAKRLVDRTTRKALTLKVFELETVRRYETQKREARYSRLSLEEQLRVLCDLISEVYSQPVLFIIDEIDRASVPGLAAFIKANSGEWLKFLLVGIATSVPKLLTDHQSLERSLMPVELPVMKQAELREIITKAVTHLEEQGIAIKFTDEAITALVAASGGFPWFTHVLGQASLMRAYDAGSRQVTQGDVDVVIAEIVENRFATQFDDDYQTAVRDSYAREVVLKSFAQWPEANIPVADVYFRIRSAGISNPSTYKSHLCHVDYGTVLITPNLSSRGVVRFFSEMFKTYVRLRPAIHSGVDENITAQWERDV